MVFGGPQKNPNSALLVVIENAVVVIIGSAVVGCRAPYARWAHLLVLGVGLWLTGLTNVALGYTTPAVWVVSAILLTVLVALGGGISALFVRSGREATSL